MHKDARLMNQDIKAYVFTSKIKQPEYVKINTKMSSKFYKLNNKVAQECISVRIMAQCSQF